MNSKYYIKRFIAAIIDLYFVGIFITIPNFILWEKVLNEDWNVTKFLILYQIFGMFIYLFYWYILERCFHTTLGKKLLKLKVIDEGNGNYFIRSACKFLPLDIISFLFTKNKRFWHDNFSHTTVVEVEK